MRWLALAVLILVGIAVAVARTGARPAAPIPVPTSTPAPRAEAPRPTAEPHTPIPTTARRVPTPTAARAVAAKEAPTAKPGVAHTAATATAHATATAPPAAPGATSTTSVATGATAIPPAASAGANAPRALPTTAPPSTAAAARDAVALTFDAGADRGYAEDILDILSDEHVVASFGITGNWARANPDLVRRMAADGHLVFNHTLDHRSFTGLSDALGGLSAAQRRAELDEADAIIAPLIGHSTRPFFRLPYGDDDARVATDVSSDGYTRKIGWTVDSEGWRGLQSIDIVARCLKLAAAGALYVMHVGRASQDAIALPEVIHQLRDRGFTFARVDAL